MASTRSRIRGREHARPSTGGVAAEHATKIYTFAIGGIVVVIAFLALTSIGHVVDAATQHFMLFYAGVFTLIALCASVGLGLVSTDRMFLNPGHRVFVQAAHRAASFGAVAFLIIHITTEILAQRSHVIDAVVPFLSPFRTFYIGLGTIASDLIILLVITGILRSRFNVAGKAWRWRAIHYTSYVAFVFGVWHGLLGGRPGKPYVDWSYGFVVAFVLIGLAVRVLSNSLKPKESLSEPPVAMSASSASAPLRAAAMLAQAGGLRGMRGPAPISGPQAMLSAPVGAPVLTALPADSGRAEPGQPYYEPGYEGPPRYLGAPRTTGPMPSVTGPARPATGPQPRAATGSFPVADTGPQPWDTAPQSWDTAPQAWAPGAQSWDSGPQYWPGTGPVQAGDGSAEGWGTGPQRRPATGPQQRPVTGPQQRPMTGPQQRPVTGPQQRPVTGPQQRPMTGPQPWPPTAPLPQTGPVPPFGRNDGYGDARPAERGWPRAGSDGSWYPDQPPWDGGLPESDPDLRYREPGPGMPGYRGSRDHRYGGDIR